MRKLSPFGFVLSAFALALTSTQLLAAAPQRISQAVSDNIRASITHNTSPRVAAASDLGEAPADKLLQTITIRFSMTAAQQAALDQFLLDVQNPASPSYHQWLTPQQFGALYGLSSSDLDTVKAWLTSKGFTVTEIPSSATSITFSGTVAQVEQAFGTQIHNLSLNGEQHFANVADPTMPSVLASVVSSISGLNDFKLKSRVHLLPKFTSSVSGNHFVVPGDFATIYNTNPLLTNSINGTGITIAVMGQTDISLSDVTAFRSASGLSTNLPTVKLVPTSPDPGTTSADIDEAQLDVEWSGAVAPSATILYVNSTDVIDTSLAYTINNNLAPIITISYGDCEIGYGSAALNSFNLLFKQANAQGQTILGPAGDSGATDCDYNSTSASNGLAVDFPASSPYVTGVGGTMFGTSSSPVSTAIQSEASSYWGGATNTANAISYIPESVWNETATFIANGSGLAAGGGGASAFFTKPYWQYGTGVPADSSRDVPDLALGAAASHDPFLICSSGWCTNGFRDAGGYLDAIGGTSVATPSFAGILALLEQKLGGTRLGNVNPTIYALANSSYYASAFHDITSGNNQSPCTIGSLNCPSSPDYIGYTATTGFDLASGWGSVNAYNFVNDWNLVTPVSSPTTSANLSQVALTTSVFNVVVGTTIALQATVSSNTTGVTTTPTGSVQFLVDGTNVGTPVALSGGVATYSLNTSSLSSGVHTVSAAYSGDSVYSGSKSAAQIDLTSAASADFTLSPTSATMTASAPGATTSPLTITVTPVNGFTTANNGAVYFTASSTSQTLNATYSFTVSPATILAGTNATTQFTLYAYSTSGTGQSKFGPVTNARNEAPAWYLAGSGITVAGLLLLTLPRRRKWSALAVALLSVGILSASGCSGGGTILSNGGTVSTATGVTTYAAPGTYPITVTAYTSAGVSHNININFVVN